MRVVPSGVRGLRRARALLLRPPSVVPVVSRRFPVLIRRRLGRGPADVPVSVLGHGLVGGAGGIPASVPAMFRRVAVVRPPTEHMLIYSFIELFMRDVVVMLRMDK